MEYVEYEFGHDSLWSAEDFIDQGAGLRAERRNSFKNNWPIVSSLNKKHIQFPCYGSL